MKRAAIFLVLVVAVLASPRVRRQLFQGVMEPNKVPALMNNNALVHAHANCIMATPERARTICDRVGLRAREVIPEMMKKADCPTACNDQEKRAMAHVIRSMKSKYPDLYAELNAHFKLTPEDLTKLDTWAESIAPL